MSYSFAVAMKLFVFFIKVEPNITMEIIFPEWEL